MAVFFGALFAFLELVGRPLISLRALFLGSRGGGAGRVKGTAGVGSTAPEEGSAPVLESTPVLVTDGVVKGSDIERSLRGDEFGSFTSPLS